ncbi:leucine-rich repeat domain-containing protein [Mycoplasma sp. ES3157-GEN-MYC]|uniref:Leucine-rich repeat protein n=1 Tax=Mycoplasma miroungigenitalium TaxID=754515 RepID=A0A6M4JBV1_9MOLU|nr:leucine-rich repeat domain-containing protein [Mycoplasma miroungigenitalium]MBU4690614.1 leucine-rich repeat domain-containing protein [Mycoplasma miroungigenitalium]MBU4691881.1 leucine-rich repeat domain-containing protein [Mycoplasma miroungigenitalium]QJR43738.1 leucine-rich repeat protein [Mycoplasma miroungigenitalium]
MKFKKLLSLSAISLTTLTPLATLSCNLYEDIDGDTYIQLRDSEQKVLIIDDKITKINNSALIFKHQLEEFKSNNITDLPENLFHFNDIALKNLKTVTANSITSIGDNTFANLTGLVTVNAPKATKIGEGAFKNARKLTTLNLGVLTTINKESFSDTTSLKTLPQFAASITTLPQSVFDGCGIESFNNSNIIKVEKSAFYNSSIKTLTLKNVQEIGENALAASNLEKIEISPNAKLHPLVFGSKLKSMPSKMFDANGFLVYNETLYGFDLAKYKTANPNATEIVLPDNVKTISSKVFEKKNTGDFKTIKANHVTTVSANAFSSNSTIESIILPQAIKVETEAFAKISKLKVLTLNANCEFDITPFGKTSLPQGLFNQQGLLIVNSTLFSVKLDEAALTTDTLTLPDSITKIHSYAFGDKIKKITTLSANSVTYVAAKAFSGNKSITKATFAPNVQIDEHAYDSSALVKKTEKK